MSERRSTADEEARSTDRPPAPAEEVERDLAAALKAAKNSSPGRYGPPAATAKIRPFELAQALALSSADADPASGAGNKPLREDDAPFVPPEVEVLGDLELEEEVPSGVDGHSSPPQPSVTPSVRPSAKAPLVEAAPETRTVPRQSYTGLVVLALMVGLGVMAYVYVYANR